VKAPDKSPLRSPAIAASGLVLRPEIPICQTDLPLDWYQEDFKSTPRSTSR
jgi:hypothetical protein